MKRFIGIASIILGIFVALTPLFIFPVCELKGYNRMFCSYTGFAEVVAGIVIVIVGVILISSRAKGVFRWIGLLILIISAVVFFIPDIIGYCHSSRMPCNYATVPALKLEGFLLGIIGLIATISSFKKEEL